MNKKARNLYAAGLILLVFFHVFNVFMWINTENWSHGKDVVRHLSNVCKTVEDREISCFKDIVFIDKSYPPFYYWTAMILFKITNSSYKYLFLNSLLFLIILILATYGIGKQIRSREAGFIAAMLCSFFPAVYRTVLQFNLELASAAMTALVIYTLFLTRQFRKTGYSVIAGIALFLGLLTRQLVAVFVLGPLLFMAAQGIKNSKNNTRKKVFYNILTFCSISAVGALIYYHDAQTSGILFERFPIVLDDLTYYIRVIPDQAGILMTILFFISSAVWMLREEKGGILACWFLLPLAVLSVPTIKSADYTIGYMPVIALVPALTLDKIPNTKIKKLIVIILVSILMCGYFRNFGL
jgi:4-amino-4-deoxy-L-arabinose transferase-like glycosyltransferase